MLTLSKVLKILTIADDKEVIVPLLIEPAKSVPTVKLLAEPNPVLIVLVFNAVPVIIFVFIELKSPFAIAKEPIEPLLIDPAKREPTFNVLVYVYEVVKDPIPAFPVLIELKMPSVDVIELTVIVSVAKTPENTILPLLYPESAEVGIVPVAYTPAAKLPTIRAAGILVRPIAEP